MVRRRLSEDSGVTGVEYALIAGLIAVVALVGITFVGRSLGGSFEDSTTALGAAMGNAPTSTPTVTPTATPSATATPTPTPTPTPSSSASAVGPVVVSVTGGGDAVVTRDATWKQVGKSGNYRWECPRGTSLGYNSIEKDTPQAPSDPPACT